ncbi:MAG: spermidine/putrescine ABC transporter substrate-binding protein [Ruminococcaceae bacterium]|nr:spermidine/putrescine ABC transporter substrate-binding protein [Oscillospiraceae bacterium]
MALRKKLLGLCLIAVMLLAAMFSVSCSEGAGDAVVLNVYNWGEYISDGSEGSLDVNAEFEEYCKSKGLNVKVNYTTFDSNESMYNKLKSGAVSYDVIFPSDYMIARMVKEDMLLPLNFDNIPNIVNVEESFKNLYYDPDQTYSVPYFVGYVGIIYNTQYVDEEDAKGWDLLWNEKYKGKILQFNNSRDAFGTALFKEGNSVNNTDETKWRSALELLKTQKKLVQGYVMDEIFNKMKNESAYIAAYYAGDFLAMYEENDNLAFYYPEEGTNVFGDAMCIPTCCKNKELAEMYINFMLEEEIGAANSEMTYYATPNKLVNQNAEYIEYMSSIHEDAMYILSPEFDEGYVTEYYHNFDEDMLKLINDLWEELKIESTSDVPVYITCVVIAAAIAVFFTVRAITQYKRRKYY